LFHALRAKFNVACIQGGWSRSKHREN